MNNLSALYGRTSTEEQREKQTIDSQVSALEKMIAGNNESVVKKYLDDGCSGAVLNRPALDELREDAKNGLFKKLYIYSPDRLSRELYVQLLVVKELKRSGIEIIFFSQKFGDDPSSQLLFQVLGSISEFERAQILERTRRGKLQKARRNMVVGSIPPYGFHYVKKTESSHGRYEINEQEKENLEIIFKTFNSPKVEGIRTLAKELYLLGIKNRSGNTKWAKSTLSRILTNETYIGTTYYNKHYACEPIKENEENQYKKNRSRRLREKDEWISIDVPQLISTELFLSTQEKLKKNSELSVRNSKHDYLLSGILYCTCSKRMYGFPCHGRPRYKCSDKQVSYPLPKKCTEGSVDTGVLDGAAWDSFLSVLERPEVIAAKLCAIEDKKGRQEKELESRRAKISQQLTSVEEQERRLLKAYAENVISIEQLKDQNNEIGSRKERLLFQRKTLDNQVISGTPDLKPEEVVRMFTAIRERATKANFELKKRIIRLFADQVIVNGRKAIIKAYLPAHVSVTSTTLAGCGLQPRQS